jgi:1,4-dihydroxy-2-naphthoate octaprenyltransferase
LSANLANDYTDSKSGADWQDTRFFGLFGGSKLIQEEVFTERFYFFASLICLLCAVLSILFLAAILRSAVVIFYFAVIVFFAFSYSSKPLQLSYRRWGEVTIFFLFGPVPVMGGYFIQTKIFPAFSSFLLSLPLGFFTTAILFANEVPDYSDDLRAGKNTLVGLTGRHKAFVVYCILMCLGFLSILPNVVRGYLKPLALFTLILIVPAVKAAGILRRFSDDKTKLVNSSRLTIMIQTWAGIILAWGALR